MPMSIRSACIGIVLTLSACSPLDQTGRAPEFSPPAAGPEHTAMMTYSMPLTPEPAIKNASARASLWTEERGSLLGDRRAMQRGDILTVVIEIDDSAQISNSSDRSRGAQTSLGVPQLFGLPQRVDPMLPDGASLGSAVDINSSSTASGDGSVRRQEKLELRVAATITNTLPNGVLSIEGSQEVRVNFEMRELLISGFVRPEDITRQNEITYDKIASARISYGGRGQISDMQQPRYGQQILETLLPL